MSEAANGRLPQRWATDCVSWELPEIGRIEEPQTEPRPEPDPEALEALREAAYQDGYEAGRAAGHALGLDEGRVVGAQHLREVSERLAPLVTQLREPLRGQDAAIRQALAILVTRVAQAVVRRSLEEPEQRTVAMVVEEALKALPRDAQSPMVRLHPADLAALRQAPVWSQPGLEWCEDPALEPGSCRVDHLQGAVTYATSDRFGQVIRQLFADLAEPALEAVNSEAECPSDGGE
ncbi:MAG: FliH/SctL family protein [Pseudomonadota bacterium]|nr:FliH/SctL family protein [Pseudomonadota bacterium]